MTPFSLTTLPRLIACISQSFLGCLLAVVMMSSASAAPDMSPLGPNIADQGSHWYHFKQWQLDSRDGERHYRVWLGIPNKPAPARGYPVLYALDGNAFMNQVNDRLLRALVDGNPPVIVAIGYQTRLPFDVPARAYDYTPRPPADNDNHAYGWQRHEGGGSQSFRQLLTQDIMPRVQHGLKLDARQRGLWGHSLGGAFVMDTLLKEPADFTHYYAASPSITDDPSAYLGSAQAVESKLTKPLTATFLLDGGIGHTRGTHQVPTPKPSKALLRHQRAVIAYIKDLGSVSGIREDIHRYPKLSHGGLFPVSLRYALYTMAGETPPEEPHDHH